MDPELRSARLAATNAKARVSELRATVGRRENDLARAQSALDADRASLKAAAGDFQAAERRRQELEGAAERRAQHEACANESYASMLAKRIAGDASAREVALTQYAHHTR